MLVSPPRIKARACLTLPCGRQLHRRVHAQSAGGLDKHVGRLLLAGDRQALRHAGALRARRRGGRSAARGDRKIEQIPERSPGRQQPGSRRSSHRPSVSRNKRPVWIRAAPRKEAGLQIEPWRKSDDVRTPSRALMRGQQRLTGPALKDVLPPGILRATGGQVLEAVQPHSPKRDLRRRRASARASLAQWRPPRGPGCPDAQRALGIGA